MSVRQFCQLCFRNGVPKNVTRLKRCYSSEGSSLTNSEVRKKRNALFEEETARQMSLIKRIEKITVNHIGPPEDCTLIMNKHLSTPYNCAMHLGELLMRRSILALVNGEPWDMHRPLVEDCDIKFLHMQDEDPMFANTAFWKSCSFVLGHVMETVFKKENYVELCSFPSPTITTGSFILDVDLKMPGWKPSQIELNCLSREASKLWFSEHKFERLEISESVAKTMFEDNKYKLKQIPHIAEHSQNNTVTIYRMGKHIDISSGPLIGNTSQIARFSVTAVHPIKHPEYGRIHRVQGLAIPIDLHLHWWTFDFLSKRAKQPNKTGLFYKKNRENDNRKDDDRNLIQSTG